MSPRALSASFVGIRADGRRPTIPATPRVPAVREILRRCVDCSVCMPGPRPSPPRSGSSMPRTVSPHRVIAIPTAPASAASASMANRSWTSNHSQPGRTRSSPRRPAICEGRRSWPTSATPPRADTRRPTELDARLAQLGAASLVQGQTDSERIFALITAETARRKGDMFDGLLAATSWISDHLPVYALNLVVSTATDLWALRYPAVHDLYVLDRPAGGTGASRALVARSSRIHAQSAHLADRASVLVASEPMDDDPGWRLLDPGELLHVDSHLTLHSSSPLPSIPRHRLDRAALDAATAASQHPESSSRS